MKKTLAGTIAEVNSQSVTVQIQAGNNVTLPAVDLGTTLQPGDPVWLTVSNEQPSDAKEILNAVLGA